MDIKALADSIITDIKKTDVFGGYDMKTDVFGGYDMKAVVSEFNRIYEQAASKAFVIGIPPKTRFRFIKRIIEKLIQPHTSKQMEFNYLVIELIRAQQKIILKEYELIEELELKNDELRKKV